MPPHHQEPRRYTAPGPDPPDPRPPSQECPQPMPRTTPTPRTRTTTRWTEPELIKALSLYRQIPFGRMHRSAPEIIALSDQLGRTPYASSMTSNPTHCK